jgi:TPP-dependent pyruvate/acetoin dehydrogenase alpha subunit
MSHAEAAAGRRRGGRVLRRRRVVGRRFPRGLEPGRRHARPAGIAVIKNHYAISTPVRRQTAAEELAARAEGYGFPGFVMSSNDLLAVYATTVDAVSRAIAGGGPTLIECRTYRLGFHNTSDKPKENPDRAEIDEAEQCDPIERVRCFAIRKGIWSADQEAAALVEIGSATDTAQRQVEEPPKCGAAAIFEHVYETLPPRLQQQGAEALDDARPS